MTFNNPIGRLPGPPRQSTNDGNLATVDHPASPVLATDQGAASLNRGSSAPAMRRQRSLPELQLRQAFNEHQASRIAQSEGTAHGSVLSQAREEFDTHTTANRLRSRGSLTAQALDHGPGVHFVESEPISRLAMLSVLAADRCELPVQVTGHPTSNADALLIASAQSDASLSRDELLAHWNRWAEAGGATGGNRIAAVRAMKAWLDGNDASATLILSSLGLTSLPDALPNSLRRLDVSANRLTHLPNSLPNGLLVLVVGTNQLTQLPDSPA